MAGTAIAFLSIASAGAALAQSATDSTQSEAELAKKKRAGAKDSTVLETVVVTAKRPASTSPAVDAKKDTALVTTTTAEDIDEKMISNWTDLGSRQDAGVNYNKQTNSINIRGLDADRVLTTIDGIEMPYLGVNDARSVTGGLDTFDFNSLSTIDIVRGADSSSIGSGGLGGLVALQTLSPDDLLKGGKKFGFLTKEGYWSADQSWSTSNAVAAKAGDTAILLQGGYTKGNELDNKGDVGGYSTTRTDPNPLDYDQYSLLGKLQQDFDGGHRLTLTGETFHYKNDVDAMTSQSLTGNYRPGDYETNAIKDRSRVSLAYDYLAPDDKQLVDEAHVTIYWQDTKREDDTNAYRSTSVIGPYIRQNQNEIQQYGINGNAKKSVDLGGHENTFAAGGELYLQKTQQYSYGEDNCVSHTTSPCSMLHTNQADSPDADGVTVGLYGRDEIAVTNQFSLTPGLRFDYYQQTPKATAGYDDNANYIGLPDASSDWKLSPSLLGTWKPKDGVALYAQWAQGFKAPTASQLYLNYGGTGAYASLGNPDLKPEESNGFEVGTKLGNDGFGGGISTFYNEYTNFIDTKSLTSEEAAARGYDLSQYTYGITEAVNVSKARIYGIEANAHYKFDANWRTWSSFAWMVGQNVDDNTYLNSVAPVKWIVGLGYSADEWGSDLSLTAVAKNAQTARSFIAPAYSLVDWTVWWSPKKVPGLKLQAGVFNLFDEKYWNYLDVPTTGATNIDFYSAPGRNVRVNMTYQF